MTTRKGAQVARRYHDEIVGPLLTRLCPHLVYAAARLGEGSDVLGLDDAMSADHSWGLRLSVLLDDAGRVDEVRALLDAELPETFAGLPVRFPLNDDGPATLAVDVAGVAAFLQRRLGADPRQALTPHQWLGLTGQSVLEPLTGQRARPAWSPRSTPCTPGRSPPDCRCPPRPRSSRSGAARSARSARRSWMV